MSNLSPIQLLFLAAIFVSTILLVAGLFTYFRRSEASQRLETIVASPLVRTDEHRSPQWVETIERLTKPLAKLSVPDDDWKDSELRRRFMHAGLRHPSAPATFFALKTVFCFGFPLVFWLVKLAAGWEMKPSGVVVAMGLLLAIGYYLPNFVLNRRIRERQRTIFESFPDAIDLLTICVEAGLGLDAALAKVANEIRLETLNWPTNSSSSRWRCAPAPARSAHCATSPCAPGSKTSTRSSQCSFNPRNSGPVSVNRCASIRACSVPSANSVRRKRQRRFR